MKDKIPVSQADSLNPKMLLVSAAAPPKGSPESLQVSKYLKYLAHYPVDVHLVTEAAPKNQQGWTTIEKKYQPVLTGLKQVIKIPLYRSQFNAFLRRVNYSMLPITDDSLLFARATKRVKHNLEVNPDIIYSRSTPFSSAILAMKLKKVYQVPWIMHLSDPWVLSPFFETHGARGNYHRHLEQQCFEHADKISFTSRDQIALYEKHYPWFKSKYVWFPNVYDDDEVVEEPAINPEKICFLHTGNFYGPGRSPGPVLKAVDRVFKDDIHCLDNVEILFTGHHEKSVDEMFRRFASIPVRHLGVLSLNRVLQLQKNAQVLIIIDWELPQELAVFLLSKAVDYMAARKPILAITTHGSTVYKLIEGVYGSCFEHHDVEGIARKIRCLIDSCRKNNPSQHPYQVDSDYSASKNAHRLFKLVQNLRNITSQGSQ